MNSCESSKPLRDCQQITCVMLNRFQVKNPSPLTLSLIDNIKLDGIPTKVKWKIQVSFLFYFKFSKGTSVKSYEMQLPVLLLFLFYISFYISRYHFLQLFRTLFCIIWKRFSLQVFLFRTYFKNSCLGSSISNYL